MYKKSLYIHVYINFLIIFKSIIQSTVNEVALEGDTATRAAGFPSRCHAYHEYITSTIEAKLSAHAAVRVELPRKFSINRTVLLCSTAPTNWQHPASS